MSPNIVWQTMHIALHYCSVDYSYRVDNKKVLHKSEEKMHKKMKMTLQRAENLVQVQEHYGISFYEKIFFLM